MDRYSREESVIAYWGMGLHWGPMKSNNKKGHLIGAPMFHGRAGLVLSWDWGWFILGSKCHRHFKWWRTCGSPTPLVPVARLALSVRMLDVETRLWEGARGAYWLP